MKRESSYQQPIDPPGSDSTATTGERRDLEGQISLSENDSALRREALDVNRSATKRGGEIFSDTVIVSSGEATDEGEFIVTR